MILRVYIFSFILLFSSRLVFSKSEIPNHFQACKGVYGEMSDQQVLCIEREENFKSIDKLAASTHQIIVQLNPKDKNRLKIPDELKTFIQKKLDDQYQRISNILENCNDSTKLECKEKRLVSDEIKTVATQKFQSFKLSMAFAFNDLPYLHHDQLLRRPSVQGGEFPLEGDTLEHPLDDLSDISKDQKINDIANDAILMTLFEKAPYLTQKAIDDVQDANSFSVISKVHRLMKESESITDYRENGERDRYISSLKQIQENAKRNYIDLLSRYPFLAYVENENVSDSDIDNILKKILSNLSQVKESLSSKDTLGADLLHYKGYVEEFLNENPKYCYVTNIAYDDVKFRNNVTDIAIESSMIAFNIGCPFLIKGYGGKVLCAPIGGTSAGYSIYKEFKIEEELKYKSFSHLGENKSSTVEELLDQHESNNFLLMSSAVSVIPFLSMHGKNMLINSGILKLGGIKPGKGTGFNHARVFKRYVQLNLDKFKPRAVSRELLSVSKDFPDAIKNKFREMREFAIKNPLDKPDINVVNALTNAKDGEVVIEILTKYPRMQKPIVSAHKLLSDTGRWVDYMEETMGHIFKRMLASGKAKLIEMARNGEIDKDTLVQYFKDKFKERGLEVSEIYKTEGTLPFTEFRKKVAKGPILDNAFTSSLQDHGPYPHLLQLDYLIDDMAKKGNVEDMKEFFDFFATDDGLKVWNDTFDLLDISKDLKNTNVVTESYLKRFGI